MNIVVIGHVDHGKSTVIGRLLADTHSLPEGKLESVKAQCVRHARPFEYAFLLDALKDEQAQGITIDSARCFFRSNKREYIIIDAPGHIEFLKNMISGAARAEAGLLIIDAKEGIQENSRRHGYMVSMLGIRQLAVCINKMDLVDYDQEVYERIKTEYGQFLSQIHIAPAAFIPISARGGDLITGPSERMGWYGGSSVLEILDRFEKEPMRIDKALRFPVQDIYKFTANNDDRRIVSGRIETGSVAVGDEVIFLPSRKRSRIASIEGFNVPPPQSAHAGQSIGITLETQIYIKPGEIMCKVDQEPATITTQLKANLFWLSSQPMVMNKQYKMKIANASVSVWLTEIFNVLDASELKTSQNRTQIERHDVAEVTLESLRPIACDEASIIAQTGRFVIIDNYEIAGGGVVLSAASTSNSLAQDHVHKREQAWTRSALTPSTRANRYNQRSVVVMITGEAGMRKQQLGKALEEYLFHCGRVVYYLGMSNTLAGIDSDMKDTLQRDEFLRRLGEIAHLFTDAGVIFITTVTDLDDYELELIETLNQPNELLVIHVGESRYVQRQPDLRIDYVDLESLGRVHDLLQSKRYIVDYQI